MSEQAYDVRLRNVEHWQQRHDGECTVRNKEQDTVNKAVWKRLDVHLSRIHGLEKRVAWITGGASAVGAILGAILGNLVKLLFVLLLALLWCATAEAQCHQVKVCDQICFGFGCKREYGLGSAVAIGRFEPGREFLLTAGHVIKANTIEIHVGVDGKWVPARLYGKIDNQSGDLAVLAISHPQPLRAVPIAQRPPQMGQTVERRGFALGGPLRTTLSTVSTPADPGVVFEPGRTLWMDAPFQQGESGGGVTCDGELVGIIKGFTVDDNRGLATGVDAIRSFIRSTLNGFPSCAVPQPNQQPPIVQPPSAPPVQTPDRTAELLGKIAALEQRIAELENRPPPQNGKDGEDGANGKDGQPGTVTVVIKDGDSVFRHEGLKSGSTVEVDINRFKKE